MRLLVMSDLHLSKKPWHIRKEIKISPQEKLSKVVQTEREGKGIPSKKLSFTWSATDPNPVLWVNQLILFTLLHESSRIIYLKIE